MLFTEYSKSYIVNLRKGAEHLNICSNFVGVFRKVQSTITCHFGALHLQFQFILTTTNILVRCTFT
jgi:hypothetical protein